MIMRRNESVLTCYCIATLSYVKEANFERPPIKYVYIKEESTKDKSIYRSGSVAGIKIYK